MVKRYVILFAGMALLAVLLRSLGTESVEGSSGLKAFLVPFATIYLNAFNSPLMAIGLCLAMVTAGLVLFLYVWLARISPARRDLRAVCAQLRALPTSGDVAALGQVDRIMQRHALVSREWRLYSATLVKQPNGRIAGHARPDRYFNMRNLANGGVRLKFFQGLPNDFVGLGLIFTFMGLVAGLYFASRSMMSADLGVAREALVQLLHAATFKFLTSITGIAISLVLTWSLRSIIGGLEAEMAELQFLMEEKFPPAFADGVSLANFPQAVSTPASAELGALHPEVA